MFKSVEDNYEYSEYFTTALQTPHSLSHKSQQPFLGKDV
jgi:hypothetical protein